MDKKNTMLLTVIAVATLLVAVVGATFAFFAIGATAENNAKTTITGSTEKVVAGAIALKGTSTLQLSLTAEDMSAANKGYYFYAGDGKTDKGSSNEAGDESSSHKVDVGTVTLGHDGTEGVKYKCTANYTIKIDNTDITFVDTDDAVLTLYNDGNDVVVSGDGFQNATTTGIKLSELVSAADTGISGKVEFNLTSSSADVTKKLQAALRIKNSEEEQQKNLADKKFNITIEATSFDCDTVTG